MKVRIKEILETIKEQKNFNESFREMAKEIMENYKSENLTADQKEKVKIMKTKVELPPILTDQELEQLLIETNSFYDCPTETDKQNMRDAYRTVEEETNKQIQEAGGVTEWYESGRGRVIEIG